MTDTCFADHARRLAGFVCLQLGWRPDHFWDATPAELAAIWASHQQISEPFNTPPSMHDITNLMEKFPDG